MGQRQRNTCRSTINKRLNKNRIDPEKVTKNRRWSARTVTTFF